MLAANTRARYENALPILSSTRCRRLLVLSARYEQLQTKQAHVQQSGIVLPNGTSNVTDNEAKGMIHSCFIERFV